MLSDFVKKKKKGVLKTMNIESIQSAIGESGDVEQSCAASRSLVEFGDIVNKEENFSSLQKTAVDKPLSSQTGTCNRVRKKTGVKSLEDYDIVSERSFVDSREALLRPGNGTDDGGQNVLVDRPFADSLSCGEDLYPSIGGCSSGDVEARKLRVMNHATKRIEVKYNRVSTALYLPRSFKMVSSLYKIISTIYNFNKKRDLALIFAKYKDSIERLFKHRVEMEMLEQLNFIANGAIRFIPVEVLEEGNRVSTFKIDIVQSIDVDFSLFNYLCETYKIWLAKNGFAGLTNRIHPDFLAQEPSIPTRPFQSSLPDRFENEPVIRKIAREKTGSILDRIKEKERLRREEFVKEQAVDRDYEGRLASLFEIGNRRALKMSDVLFKLGGFDCRTQVLKVLGEKYAVRKINNEEYIVKR